MSRIPYQQVLENLRLLERLAAFEPTLIGTPPLGIATESSDIDIACTAACLDGFRDFIASEFASESHFLVDVTEQRDAAAVRAEFVAYGWDIELWCQSLPVSRQWGVRHFQIERRLLDNIPGLRREILDLKRSGLKTEPAFARALNLQGDPYAALLELETWSDSDMQALRA